MPLSKPRTDVTDHSHIRASTDDEIPVEIAEDVVNRLSQQPGILQPLEVACWANGGSWGPAFQRRSIEVNSTEGPHLKTLEEAVKFFDLHPYLQGLEESLNLVRLNKETPEEHKRKWKTLDKEFQKLSCRYHPDKAINSGSSEEEVKRAKELQTALNGTRTALRTLNRIFLEDIDIDHKYSFFCNLDITLLGNEDAVKNHVDELLLKIILVSEIKQGDIVAAIRPFLVESQRCIEMYLADDFHSFESHRSVAFSYLESCFSGYTKLYSELQMVEAECKEENLQNILPTLRKMATDCGQQLKHLEKLLQLSKRPFGTLLPMYSSSVLPVDEYYVRPIISYVNVILACSTMIKMSAKGDGMRSKFSDTICSWWNKIPNPLSYESNEPLVEEIPHQVDDISLMYNLAGYDRDKRCERSVNMKFRGEHVDKKFIRSKFREILERERTNLQDKFKADDYVEKGTNKYILKELKACREMMAEFQKNKEVIEKGIEKMQQNNNVMTKRLDKVLVDSERLCNQFHELREDTQKCKNEIEEHQAKVK